MCSQDAYGSAEHLSGKSPGVSSLLPGDLFDVELSKQDSGLGISVTVLFGKVFHPLRFFLPPLPFLSHCFDCRALLLLLLLLLLHGWLSIGSLSALYWLSLGSLLALSRLSLGSLLALYRLFIGWCTWCEAGLSVRVWGAFCVCFLNLTLLCMFYFFLVMGGGGWIYRKILFLKRWSSGVEPFLCLSRTHVDLILLTRRAEFLKQGYLSIIQL